MNIEYAYCNRCENKFPEHELACVQDAFFCEDCNDWHHGKVCKYCLRDSDIQIDPISFCEIKEGSDGYIKPI
jgi:hypothetical protein